MGLLDGIHLVPQFVCGVTTDVAGTGIQLARQYHHKDIEVFLKQEKKQIDAYNHIERLIVLVGGINDPANLLHQLPTELTQQIISLARPEGMSSNTSNTLLDSCLNFRIRNPGKFFSTNPTTEDNQDTKKLFFKNHEAKHLNKTELADFNSKPILGGNTALHDLMLSKPSYSILQAFISNVGRTAAEVMAKTLNDKKELALDLDNYIDISFEDQDKIHSLLLSLTLPSEFKPLSEKLDFADIQAIYQAPQLSPLAINLYLGSEAVNYVRDHIKESSTHPDRNSLSVESDIGKRINELRNESKKEIYSSSASNNLLFKFKTRFPVESGFRKQKLTKQGYDRMIMSDAEIGIDHGVGNCYEMSAIVKYFFLKFYPEKALFVELVDFGNHVFVVIGRKHESPCYKDWAEEAVICDPWSGEVYPAAMIPEKLKDFAKRVVFFYTDQFEIREYNLVIEPNFNLYQFEFDYILKELGEKTSSESFDG